MQCPNCQQDNEPTNRFCIFCGALLPVLESKQPLETLDADIGTLTEQVQELRQEVSRLSTLIDLMNNRLATIEGLKEVPTPTPEPIPATPAVQATITERRESPVSEVPTTPVRKPRPPTAIEQEWEQILGGNWLARIGVFLLIIGMGFFLKYAFEQNWLGPTARVILGTVAGLGMVGGGHYWHIRYPIFAQAISGGGIALLYLSIFAAFAFFGLIGFYLAIGLLLVISVASALLSLRYNAMALAIISIIGAFIAPFILAVSAVGVSGTGAVQAGQSFWLLVYIMVVDIGVLWLSTFRNWRWFTLLSLLGSLAVFGVWHDRFGDEVGLLTSMVNLTLIFLIFVGATTLYHIVWRRVSQAFDYTLMVVNATSYFGISYALLWDDLRAWIGGFSLLLALFYGGLAYGVIRRGTENVRLSLFALGTALVFLTVAIPVQLGDRAWTTIAWAAQATILLWLSLRLRMPLLRFFSYAVYIIMVVRLLFIDAGMHLPAAQPFLNERFLAFLISIISTYFAGYLLWRERNILSETEQTSWWSVYPIFLITASLFFTVAMHTELGNSIWTTIAWATQGTLLVWGSLRLHVPQFRIYGYGVFAAVAIRLLFFDTTVDLRTFTPVLNERFLSFLISIIAISLTGYLLWRQKNILQEWEEKIWSVYPVFLVAANFFSIWLLSVEVWGHFSKQLATLAPWELTEPMGVGLQSARNLSLTSLWAVYAAILLFVGITRRLRPVRLAALGLLAIPIVKVFAYDVWVLDAVYQIIAFISLGILLVASGYLYQRYQKAITDFIVKG